jgi:uncharacterized RDD family membrane protein YckC
VVAIARDPIFGGVAGPAQATAHRVHAAAQPDAAAEAAVAEQRYSGFVTRTIAFALDAALIDLAGLAVGAVVALVFSILPVSHDVKTAAIAIGGVAFVLWAIAYFTTFWTTTGVTPGNRAMRIRVVRADAAPLRVRHALARLAGMVIGVPLLIGYWPILVTDRRRGLHDAMAGTVVVDTPDTNPQERPHTERTTP